MRYGGRSLLILALVTLFMPSGCDTFRNMNKTGKNAIVGGAAGGAVGAGVGALIGGGKGLWIGALIGSAVGAGAGAAVGNQMDRQKKELERELQSVKSQLGNVESKVDSSIMVKDFKDSNNLQGIRVVLGNSILFPTGSSSLSPSAYSALSKIAYNLNQNPNTLVTVVGYTDDTGGYDMNMQLSKQRAQSVANYLISQGVAPSRITVKGEGWNNPITSNATAQGRAQNRRVEIYITANEQMIKDASQY